LQFSRRNSPHVCDLNIIQNLENKDNQKQGNMNFRM
jgi:hypothetical protein